VTIRNGFSPLVLLSVLFCGAAWMPAKKSANAKTVIRRQVNLVQLDVAVTNKKGNYVGGLRPSSFAVYEDGIREKLATFGEESEALQSVINQSPGGAKPRPAQLSGSSTPTLVASHSVFILFDTSNYMYRSFVFAQDAIAEFVRSLNTSDRLAFYSYSRDLSRDALLTSDRTQVLSGVRATVAGDDAALYNSLLLTLKDAARFSGRRVVVVFSNGPDNASVVTPQDVLGLAQSEGVPIYMVSTRKALLDSFSAGVFERICANSGGKAYFAKNWEEEQKAFASIQNDLAHLYSLSYYPQPNPNRGWRRITVKLVGPHLKKYRIRTRSGYRPRAAWLFGQVDSNP